MTTLASNIITRARNQLIDTGSQQRWTDAELLQWLGDGERSIVQVLPWAYQKMATIALVLGTKQTLPSDANSLIEVVRNKNVDGTDGAAVFMIDRGILDQQYSDWHTANGSATVKNYTYDMSNPSVFYVYPANNGSGRVEINYSAAPTDLVNLTDLIHVRDIFATPLVDYVLYRAHQKDSDYAAGQQLAGMYLQSFVAFLQAQPGAVTK